MITFGDNVKILPSPETEELGIARKNAQVYGESVPSLTGVEVIGESDDDYAINIYLHDSEEQLWIYPNLVEFLDHGEGAELVVGNVRAVRRADGSWDEIRIGPEKKWWEFWK